MATEVGHAVVSIIPSMRGFSSATQSALRRSGVDRVVGSEMSRGAGRAGTKSGSTFANAFNSRAKVGLSARTGVFATIGSSVRGLVPILGAAAGAAAFFGLRTAGSMEQAQVAFTTMLGSAKEAKSFVAGLVQFAKTTPFDFPGITTASQELLAFGFAADDVLPTLTALGDAAAGLSLGTEGLDRLTTAVGQISAKGRVQSEELLQLTESGVPALRILANQFGVTTQTMQDMVTKGLVPANRAIPALLSGLESGTDGLAGATAKFGGLMEKQSHTLSGVMSNLRDTISQGLARAVKPLLPVLEEAIPAAMERLPGIFRGVAHGLQDFLTGLGLVADKSPGAASGLERLGGAIRSTFDFVAKHKDLFGTLALGILAAKAAALLFIPVMVALDVAMDANPIGAVVLGLEALVVGFVVAWRHSQTFRKVVGAALAVVATYMRVVASVWLGVVGSIVHAASTAFGWVPGIGGKLKGAAEAFDNFRANVDNTLSGIASDALNFGDAAGRNFAGGFNKAAARGFNAIAENVNAALSGLAGSVNSFFEGLPKVKGPELAGNLNPNVNTGGGDLPLKNPLQTKKKVKVPAFDLGTAFSEGIGEGVAAGTSKVKTSMADLADKILGPLKELKQKAAQFARSIADAITGDTGFGSLAGMTDSLGSSFGLSVENIIKTFTEQRDDVREFRKNLRKLRRRGLSKGAVADIAAMGAEAGGAIASTLLDASSGQLKRISRLRRGTNQAAAAVGADVSRDRYGERIAREQVRALRRIERAQHDTDLSDRTVRRLSHAYERAAASVKPYVDVTVIDRRDGVRVRTA